MIWEHYALIVLYVAGWRTTVDLLMAIHVMTDKGVLTAPLPERTNPQLYAMALLWPVLGILSVYSTWKKDQP
jgi:hypothetical protein